MATMDSALRLAAALVVGGAIGINRDLHHKPVGLRTLSLVGLGSALAVLAVAASGEINAVSRIIQGILTGIGFLGAAVIVRTLDGEHIYGLTTAAATWLTASLGVVCGGPQWPVLFLPPPPRFSPPHP